MKTRVLLLLAIGVCFAAAPSLAVSPVYVVNSTGDEADDNVGTGGCHTAAGTCTLRAALQESNALPSGGSIIHFNIVGAGCAGSPVVCTIQPAADLPLITAKVSIDGYSQPGATPNTNGPTQGTNAVLTVVLDGRNTSGSSNTGGLVFTTGSQASSVRGLVINRCPTAAIEIHSSGATTVAGNFLGTDPTGTIALGNYDGVRIAGGDNNVVGGPAPADRNLLSGNLGNGFDIDANFLTSTTGHVVQGNLVGTNAAGTAALGNALGIRIGDRGSNSVFGGTTPAERNVISGNTNGGISMSTGLGSGLVMGNVVSGNWIGLDVTGTSTIGNGGVAGVAIYGLANTVGGSAAGAGNVISGNSGIGLYLDASDGSIAKGNRIGTDPTGTIAMGNGGTGVSIVAHGVQLGGTAAGDANVIAYNGSKSGSGGGVLVFGSSTTNAILGNSIYGNTRQPGGAGGLGIDLGNGSVADNVTPNDLTDPDSGANLLQNFPILTAVTPGASSTHVQGLLQSLPSTTYRIEFFSSDACLPRPHDFYQGKTYLGFANVTTDSSGDFSIDTTLPVVVGANEHVTMTATDPLGNTSEFSQRTVLSISPASGSSTGGTSIAIHGMQFQPGTSTVTIGGVPATNVSYVSQYQLTADVPARAPGSVSDVTVVNPAPSPLSGTLTAGWVSDFLDVPLSNGFEPFVAKLIGNLITAGCGAGNYCPSSPVTRAQMAVFLLRGKNGVCYLPPPATGTVFTDVSSVSFAAAYIEALAAAQVTGGCGGGNYCPGSNVTRAQMAVFLLRTLEGPAYTAPPCVTATFGDVPCASGFAPWIYELVARGITAGCGGGNFCPNNSVTRGQMAVFLVTTFGLP